MTKYNLDKIVKITVCDFFPARYFTYNKEVKFLGVIIKKSGIYDFIGYFAGYIPENHTLKENVLYENPEVEIWFQDKSRMKFYFNSFEEAKRFEEKITKTGNWL